MSTTLPARGRGRGRGRGAGREAAEPFSFGSARAETASDESDGKAIDAKDATAAHASSSSATAPPTSTPMNTNGSGASRGGSTSSLLSNTLRAYHGLNDNASALAKVTQALEAALEEGGLPCLICIDDIKRLDALWTCDACYRSFHLQCIQQWVRDGVVKSTGLSDDLFPEQERPWNCPNCRCEYARKDAPRQYLCFCGKVVDPPANPWLTPHSCGETCGRKLQPPCGHACVLLCHPGPCPPCPQVISRAPCYCSKTTSTRRCGDKNYSCGNVCGKTLACNVHSCPEVCHTGPCAPCQQQSQRQCMCGRSSKLTACSSPAWNCGQVCNRPFTCGFHRCDNVCHPGTCGECPRQGVRTCPCGKTRVDLDCRAEVPCCGDTCDKLLPCGKHRCLQRCHTGDCEPCVMMAERRCRCGASTRTMMCSGGEFTCDRRCGKMRNCGRHQCRRRCCDGKCPPCPEVCGQRLSCKNHTCASPCHLGPCYACAVTVMVACHCGKTTLSVPCGREKVVKAPKCHQPCEEPPYCRHDQQAAHDCHFGPCPDCDLPCPEVLSCGHACAQPCHDLRPVVETVTLTKTAKKKLKDGGEVPKLVHKQLTECPPCRTAVERSCIGAHLVKSLQCSANAQFACEESCGRMLSCGRHACQQNCHLPLHGKQSWRVIDEALRNLHGLQAVPTQPANVYDTCEGLKKEAGDGDTSLPLLDQGCGQCSQACNLPRPAGCTHRCPSGCHSGDCEPCSQSVAVVCFCTASRAAYTCRDWNSLTVAEQEKRRCCSQRCPKLMACGHRCDLTCHPGDDCGALQTCTKKVIIRCPCKTRKQELLCHVLAEARQKNPESTTLACGPECDKKKGTAVEPAVVDKKAGRTEFSATEKLPGSKKKQEETAVHEAPTPALTAKAPQPLWLAGVIVAAAIAVIACFLVMK